MFEFINIRILSEKTRVLSVVILLLVALFISGCSSSSDRANQFYENGMMLLEKGELNKANIEFKNALQLDRTMKKAILGMVLISEKQSKPGLTISLLNNLLDIDPKHIDALVKLGRLQLIGGYLDKALDTSDKAFSINNTHHAVLSLRAAIYLKLNDTKSAISIAQQVVNEDPHYIDALIVLATERLTSGDTERAIFYLEQGLSKNEKNIVLQLIKIEALEKRSENDLAEGVFKRLIDYYPDVSSFKYALAKFYLKHNKKIDAVKAVREIVSKHPGDLSAKLNLISILKNVKGEGEAQKQQDFYLKNEPNNFELKFAILRSYIGDKKLERSNSLLEDIITNAPNNEIAIKGNNIKAGLLLRSGEKDKAQHLIDQILNADKRNENALILQSRINMEDRNYDSAIANLRLVLKDNPGSSRALYLLAESYYFLGSTELADEQYYNAFKKSKYNAAYGIQYAKFLLKINSVNKAEKILSNVVKISPGNIAAYKLLAKTRLLMRDWLGAQQASEMIKKAGDTSGFAHQIESEIVAGKEGYSKSIEFLKKAHQTSPGNLQPVVTLVKTYLSTGRVNEARRFIDRLLNTNADNKYVWLLSGRIYESQKKYQEAINAYDEIVLREPTSPIGYYHSAVLKLKQKNNKQAYLIINAGLKKSPDSFSLLMVKASIYERTEKYEDAIYIYERLIKAKKNTDIVANNLASLLTEVRNDKESHEKAYKLSLRFRSSEIPQFKDTYGWACHKLGKYYEAEQALSDVVKAASTIPIFHYHIGMNYLAIKDNKKASMHLNKALDLAGDNYFRKRDEIKIILMKL